MSINDVLVKNNRVDHFILLLFEIAICLEYYAFLIPAKSKILLNGNNIQTVNVVYNP